MCKTESAPLGADFVFRSWLLEGEQILDIYHIWCDLKPGSLDTDFTQAAETWLQRLEAAGLINGFRITRRKLGLGPADLGEFHLMLEVTNLAQLDEAFARVSARSDPEESFHFAVNSKVQNVRFALYRDFPDAHRARGEEKF